MVRSLTPQCTSVCSYGWYWNQR